MNRWLRVQSAKVELAPQEELLHCQENVRIDDGDKKTAYQNGNLSLTSHRLVWINLVVTQGQIVLHLSQVVSAEDEQGKLISSDKIVLKLAPANPGDARCCSSTSNADYVRLAFKCGGQRLFMQRLRDALKARRWLARPAPPAKAVRSGIGGIEKSLVERARRTDAEISKAFEDLDKLMDKAKPMVALANSIAKKIREQQGDISDDETVRLKSYLMSLGIADPVTRSSHGSEHDYYIQLAREVYQILDKPIQEQGGMITLTDAYCRVNRARGLELVSPEDLLNACASFPAIPDLPVCLHTFEATGVTVIQLLSAELTSQSALDRLEQLVAEAGSLTAEELARQQGLAVVLAKERLLAAERCGRVCRDDSVEGLKFYPNLFLVQQGSV